MKLWLDDTRPAPSGWTWVKTADDAIDALKTGTVTHMSLDHDLGFDDDGRKVSDDHGCGYDVCLYMADDGIWPTDATYVHSHNPVGAKNMIAIIDRYGPYDRRVRYTPYVG